MMPDVATLNWLSILVAAIAAFVIGFLWHGPLFGAQWIKLMGIPQSEVDAMKAKGMGAMVPNMLGGFVQQIVIATVVAHFVNVLGIADAMQAAMLAFVLWLGFVATIMANGFLWEGRSVQLYLFNIAYHLVTLVAIAEIVTLWT